MEDEYDSRLIRMFVEDELNREYRSKRWRICWVSVRNQNIDRNRADFFGNDGRFRENLFVCFDFEIANPQWFPNRLRIVSKSEQLRRSVCFTRTKGDLVICSLLHACGVIFRGKIGN